MNNYQKTGMAIDVLVIRMITFAVIFLYTNKRGSWTAYG